MRRIANDFFFAKGLLVGRVILQSIFSFPPPLPSQSLSVVVRSFVRAEQSRAEERLLFACRWLSYLISIRGVMSEFLSGKEAVCAIRAA